MPKLTHGFGELSFVAGIGLLISGCNWVPKARLNECHQASQSLHSELARTRDQLVKAKTLNVDLAERAVDDSRKIQTLQAARDRLEKSVMAYQDDRERMAKDFAALKRQVEVAILPGDDQLAEGFRSSELVPPDHRDDSDLSDSGKLQ